MLAIEVAFLTGRYVATTYNTRTDGEWPPHPARLYSALVATHFAAAPDDVPHRLDERAALEWLERQGAPSIRASEAAHRDLVTVYVPVNDAAMTDVDEEATRRDEAARALREAEASNDLRAAKKCANALERAEATLQKAIEQAVAIPAASANFMYGKRLLPEYRERQPRTFPSVTPVDPRVTYIWPASAPTAEQRSRLDQLLERVVRVGHSSSLVSVRIVDAPGYPTWEPSSEGEAMLRVVESGQLAALERAFDRHHEVEPRVMPAVPQPYTRSRPAAVPPIAASIFSDDWLVLRRTGGPAFPMTAAVGLSRALRKALMSYADEPIAEMLSGHQLDGGVSKKPHLAVVPLPFVGHEHASGTVLGFALILPRAAGADERRAVYRAVAMWEQTFRQEDEDAPTVQLNLGRAGELSLERVESAAVQASLTPRAWCGPARVWQSVTPVALDRNPGNLRSRDRVELAGAIRQTQEILKVACERIALPRPCDIEILPSAPWAGGTKARLFPPYPGDAARTQRVLTHVRIEFSEPVKGPILLGAGRFVGLGLFKPAPAS